MHAIHQIILLIEYQQQHQQPHDDSLCNVAFLYIARSVQFNSIHSNLHRFKKPKIPKHLPEQHSESSSQELRRSLQEQSHVASHAAPVSIHSPVEPSPQSSLQSESLLQVGIVHVPPQQTPPSSSHGALSGSSRYIQRASHRPPFVHVATVQLSSIFAVVAMVQSKSLLQDGTLHVPPQQIPPPATPLSSLSQGVSSGSSLYVQTASHRPTFVHVPIVQLCVMQLESCVHAGARQTPPQQSSSPAQPSSELHGA
mmetsp:Transcript_28082/g.43226  ORF Transcript_28082/g.43226 Transcript_28082/m.43226 type:complete len:254 (-) Transcript_28082:387-1148(-)